MNRQETTNDRGGNPGQARVRDRLKKDLLVGSAVALAVAVGSACIDAGWALASGTTHQMIRQVPVLWIARYLANAMNHALLIDLPDIVNQSLAIGSARGFLVFLGGATLVNALWTIAAIAAMFAVWPLLDRLLRAAGDRRSAALGALSAFALTLPMTVGLVDHFLRSQRQMRTIALAVGVSIAIAAATFGLLMLRRVLRSLRRTLGILAATTVLLAGVATAVVAAGRTTSPAPPARPDAPNILLISIDSLRADRLHCYGNPRPTSPTIDMLASQGALFENAIAPTSWTLPSHMTLMTALPPSVHGVNEDYLALREGVPTLASVLWDEGYDTAGIVSGIYLDRGFGFGRGFEHYDDYSVVTSSSRFQRRNKSADKVAGLATRWLSSWKAQRDQRPFFLFVHFWDVHYDYIPPPPFDTMFDPGYHGPVTGDIRPSGHVYPGMPERDLQHLIALYDGEVRATDTAIGRVIDWLGGTNLLDHTIVVLVSDHGDEFLEHGHVGHRETLYDDVLHVPIVMRYPSGIPAGRRIPEQVRLMDVAPTILSLAGIQRRIGVFDTGGNPAWLATNLTPFFDARRANAMPPLPAFGNLLDQLVSLRTLRAKIIVNLQDGTKQFYDLRTDPGEQSNAWRPGNPAASAFFAELERWRARVKGSGLAERTQLTREQKDALRALGYLN